MMTMMMMMPDASKLATGPESCTISPFFFCFGDCQRWDEGGLGGWSDIAICVVVLVSLL